MDKDEKNKKWRLYYAENKDKINQKRRERYAAAKGKEGAVGTENDVVVAAGGSHVYVVNDDWNLQSRNRENKDKINQRRRERYAAAKGKKGAVGIENDVVVAAEGSHVYVPNDDCNLQSRSRGDGRYNEASVNDGCNLQKTNCRTDSDQEENGRRLFEVPVRSSFSMMESNVASRSHGDRIEIEQGDMKRRRCHMLPTDDRYIRLPRVPPCKYCGAYKFYKETDRVCCQAGEVVLAESNLPEYLVKLITGTDARSKNFMNMIRTYNNHLAYTTIGIHCDEQYQRRDRGVYTVKVQGQIYHFLGDLIPQNGSQKLSGLQFYFYDPEHQVGNRISALPRLDVKIVQELVTLMESNPYSQFLKKASSLEDPEQYHIVIKCDPKLDQRICNKPTSNEVAGIWIEDETEEADNSKLRDIRVYTRSGQSRSVKYYYGCYDPLQYVLMFPNGEPGWHGDILKTSYSGGTSSRASDIPSSSLNISNCTSFEDVIQLEEEGVGAALPYDEINEEGDELSYSNKGKRKTVSCREYYVYKLQHRIGDKSYILRFGRLLQQYVIDNYIKLESMRLDYLRNNQKRLRQEHYQGVVDSVAHGIQLGGRVGKRVYLPATFMGCPRDMKQRFLDSMCLVQEFGKPDIFLTMTCNPRWPEITNLLEIGEEAQNRPDLLARVFKAKLSVMHDKITSGEVFGKIASVVHVVEFQKRGLPHAHFLIILKPEFRYFTPEAYDRIVCAELPNDFEDSYLYGLVLAHMMHGPCGSANPGNPCMRDGKCKNHYPKEYIEQTSHGKGTYPMYRRRNDGRRACVRGKLLDNRWVVPYNPKLIAEFNCHINVEVCCDIRAVKYLYKYIHKGHDKVKFRISPDSSGGAVDEISDFQNARWVSPVEATWRIFAFPLHGMYPSVIQLQVHLPNFQSVHFQEDADLKEVLQVEKFKRTMLTEFFRMNDTDLEAKKLQLLYKDFPKYFVWSISSRTWTKRKKGVVVGRLCMVSPIENERYFLRILLANVNCPTSFDDLLTINGNLVGSFREAAYKRGFLQNDDDSESTMEEASIYKMPAELRRLFATILFYCNPADPASLFEKYYPQMTEDFHRDQHVMRLSEDDILQKVLEGINNTLESLGTDVNKYNLTPIKLMSNDFDRFTREIIAEQSIPISNEDLHAIHKLNEQQKKIFDVIFTKAMSNSGGAFFIDGPGGTGKSFLYKVLLAHIRSRGFIGIIVASSGIASSNFLGGRTAHSRFKIPIDGGPNVKCQIKMQSSEAELIRCCRIIIWDEAPMIDKSVISAFNKMLQEVCGKKSPFGDKLVVFGGDFRQVLPIVRGGDRQDQVNASLVSSDLWNSFTKLRLTENMRAMEDPAFTAFLMRIGNGEEPTNAKGQVELPEPMVIKFRTIDESVEDLISHVYPNINDFKTAPSEMMERTILCPKNEFVDDINSKLIERLPGEKVEYISDDRAKNDENQGEYLDYLNSLEPRGMPQHILVLKENSPVILLRNINPVQGLCNGTRLICRHLLRNVVGAEIASGQFCGKLVWIPRIPLEPNPGDNKYMVPFIRRQIPLKLCFAMTINKSQGQTLDFVGLYLKQPVFSHGQLYVALSRARTGARVKALIFPPTCLDEGTNFTTNVVYDEVLKKANDQTSRLTNNF